MKNTVAVGRGDGAPGARTEEFDTELGRGATRTGAKTTRLTSQYSADSRSKSAYSPMMFQTRCVDFAVSSSINQARHTQTTPDQESQQLPTVQNP